MVFLLKMQTTTAREAFTFISDTLKLNTIKTCVSTRDRYHIPQACKILHCLRNLCKSEILALRPFVLHNGNYKVHQHGYRQKDGFTRVLWSQESVLEKISKLDPSSNIKCVLAYRYLTTSPKSRYSHFIQLREQQLNRNEQVNLYDHRQNDRIECALWPHLYPFHEWCETRLSGNTIPS